MMTERTRNVRLHVHPASRKPKRPPPRLPPFVHVCQYDLISPRCCFLAWVKPDVPIQVLGPTFIVHPSSPHKVCIAFDGARQRITVSSLPDADEDEGGELRPKEVSQVWVTTRVAGSETINLRTADGKFMSCDVHGIVSADREVSERVFRSQGQTTHYAALGRAHLHCVGPALTFLPRRTQLADKISFPPCRLEGRKRNGRQLSYPILVAWSPSKTTMAST